MRRIYSLVTPMLMALALPFCAAPIRSTMRPLDAPPASLWIEPIDLDTRDLFNGPWGAERAPDPTAHYRLVQHKHSGVNPGLTVRDPLGREWSVKQPGADIPDEGPVEVTLSRVLSAVGYHQPAVYYLRSFMLEDDWGTHLERGGRFRLKDKALKDRGEWSWQQNPFVGTTPYRGLLVMLMIFNSTDLKNENNTLYEYRSPEGLQHWYSVRDLGGSLGTTGRLAPRKNDAEAFERHEFITGVRNGFVEFHYQGWHRELLRDQITVEDVAWASHLLDRLSDRQWQDAFRAGGYDPDIAARFIRTVRQKLAVGRRLGSAPGWSTYEAN
jgi:hypothetical protein